MITQSDMCSIFLDDRYDVYFDFSDNLRELSTTVAAYAQPYRICHGLNYLKDLVNRIKVDYHDPKGTNQNRVSGVLLMSALYHRSVYLPTCFNNEEQAVGRWFASPFSDKDKYEVAYLILSIKAAQGSGLAEVFNKYVYNVLIDGSNADLREYEANFRSECLATGKYDTETYLHARMKQLTLLMRRATVVDKDRVEYLINHVLDELAEN